MIRLAVRVRREHAEIVLAELLELAPAGVEEVQVTPEVTEYAVYGAPGELPSLPDLKAVAGDALVEISTSETPGDWQERWKRFHRPVLIEPPAQGSPPQRGSPPPRDPRRVPALYVRPPWEAPSGLPEDAVREIVIDPGQAFGTGAHASTRLCLELLLELAAQEGRAGAVVDIGTGSGVLAVAASQLGFAPVLGLDHERESVYAARENAAANGVTIEVRRFELRPGVALPMDIPQAGAGPPVVLANLLRPLLLELARALPRPPSHLIAGGLLRAEVDEVSGVFAARLGMRECMRRASGEWAAVWLATP